VAARRAEATRAGLGRLANREAALMAPPQWGQISGAGSTVFRASVFLREGRVCINGDVFGGSENGFKLAEDHDDHAGRVLGEEAADDLAGGLFGVLVAHGWRPRPAPGVSGAGLRRSMGFTCCRQL
jgi:hypothetical protein